MPTTIAASDYPERVDAHIQNEATTRNVIINPMLEALGWNLCNLDQCGYAINTGPRTTPERTAAILDTINHRWNVDVARTSGWLVWGL